MMKVQLYLAKIEDEVTYDKMINKYKWKSIQISVITYLEHS